MSDQPRPLSLGERVKLRREERGWSQRELAIRAEVNHAVISRLEDGTRTSVSLDVARRIARALGVGLDYLANTFDGEAQDPDVCQEVAPPVEVMTQPLVTTLVAEDRSREYT